MAETATGTHLGHLDPQARQRRTLKNLRNANRVHPKGHHGLDMPVPGAARPHHCMVSMKGRDRRPR